MRPRRNSQEQSWDKVLFPIKPACSVASVVSTLCDPMDCSLPGSSVHGISQARILERGAISSSRGSSRPRDRMLEPVSPELQMDSLPLRHLRSSSIV